MPSLPSGHSRVSWRPPASASQKEIRVKQKDVGFMNCLSGNTGWESGENQWSEEVPGDLKPQTKTTSSGPGSSLWKVEVCIGFLCKFLLFVYVHACVHEAVHVWKSQNNFSGVGSLLPPLEMKLRSLGLTVDTLPDEPPQRRDLQLHYLLVCLVYRVPICQGISVGIIGQL